MRQDAREKAVADGTEIKQRTCQMNGTRETKLEHMQGQGPEVSINAQGMWATVLLANQPPFNQNKRDCPPDREKKKKSYVKEWNLCNWQRLHTKNMQHRLAEKRLSPEKMKCMLPIV